MMFRGGGDITPPVIGWRKPSAGEAFQTGCCVFTISMTLQVLWYALAADTVAFDRAFFYATCWGVGFALASLPLKSKMVVLR